MKKKYRIKLENVIWYPADKKMLLVKIPTPVTASQMSTHNFFYALNGSLFELDNSGLAIWKMLIKNYDSERILKTLSKKYSFSGKKIRSDFMKFIKRLKREGILDEIYQDP